MSIPRGFALMFGDLATGGWDWRAFSRRGHTVDAVTVLYAWRPPLTIVAMWVDGAWATGLVRHPDDPVPVPIGARMLRPIVSGSAEIPRWARPDLNAPRPKSKAPRSDEGTPAHLRWNPEIEAGAQAGMDRIAHYNRTREWT